MESLIEQQRVIHEEIERLELAVVNEYRNAPKQHKERVAQEHCVNDIVGKVTEKSRMLIELYEDRDGSRKEEIDALSGPNEFNEFYKRLKAIKDYHRRFPNESAVPMDYEFAELENRREEVVEGLETVFTGEEGFGRFLDLNAVYDQYVNLKQIEKISYAQYVTDFDKFYEIPKGKKNVEYKKYLESLFTYMEDFLGRVKPLVDRNQQMVEVEKKFEEDWSQKSVPGWFDELGLEDNPLFCVPCSKQFAKKTLFDAHLEGARHRKAIARQTPGAGGVRVQSQAESKKDEGRDKSIALLELKITKLAELLGEERENTKSNIERRQGRTWDEREEDIELEDAVDSDSDDEDRPYNPLNLPLGWDGKPIPYWLYKLHGLGVEYKCEICGNYTYMGRKPFERHFTEWRHTYGLRCLGIPNIKHFAEVTSIEGAKTLWSKIQRDKDRVVFKPEQEEEFEDQRGNVFNKKTYEDLRRQGLL